MIYSVFNWNAREYDLFEGPGEQLGQRPASRVNGGGPDSPGVQLEAAMPVLPSSARRVGRSVEPKGRVALHHSSPAVGLGAYDTPQQSPLVHSPWLTLGVIVGGAIAAYRLLFYVARRF